MANRVVAEGFSAVDYLPVVFEQVYDGCHGGDRGWGALESEPLESERLEAELAVVGGH